MRPQRQQPTRLARPLDSPGKDTGVGFHCLLQCMKVKSETEVAQSCPTLSDPMDWSLPGSSVHGIFQARVLEWVAIAFSINQLQIPPHQKKDPPESDCSHPKISSANSLRSGRIWMFFLRTMRLSLIWLELFTQKQHISFKMAQVPPCSGIRRSISYLFWSTTPAKLCWLIRATLRKFIPRNLILGIFIRMTFICSTE